MPYVRKRFSFMYFLLFKCGIKRNNPTIIFIHTHDLVVAHKIRSAIGAQQYVSLNHCIEG